MKQPDQQLSSSTWVRASNANASRSGTFKDHYVDVYGQSQMVTSVQDGILQLVLVSMGSTSTKKYKLYCVSGKGEGCKETCFYLIGHGTMFSTKHYCTMTHKRKHSSYSTKSTMFIAKSATMAFADPYL
jgi:hypothetical protein